MPTLAYNCNITPALCANVAQARPGTQNGGVNEVFGWDPDGVRKNLRRRRNCPSKTWKNVRNQCPRSNQPQVHPLGTTNIYPVRINANFAVLTLGQHGQTMQTGLMMSCDEFPPAMSIQGGKGRNGLDGSTYCAPSEYSFHLHRPIHAVTVLDAALGGKTIPQDLLEDCMADVGFPLVNSGCSKTQKALNISGIDSEQDWQRYAHGFLSNHVAATSTDIWAYRLQTVMLSNSNVATYVTYVPSPGQPPQNKEFPGGKRDVTNATAAVYAILNSGFHLHLDIPHGHTPENTIRLHEQITSAPNRTLPQSLDWTRDFDKSELLRPYKTARRLFRAQKREAQRHLSSPLTLKRSLDKFAASSLRNTTLNPTKILQGLAHQDLRLDPPVPILQIGLAYTLLDVRYNVSNSTHSREHQDLKRSCE
ncbi:MAG: hypothetical protein Q9222_002551 [Ikaeria aurantiellina]